MERPVLTITMLGEFSISYGDKLLNEQNKRSRKMWALLQYLIAYHKREIPQSELIGLLWPEDKSDNPTSALKTQLHRLRSMLSALDVDSDEGIIVNSSGTYAFNDKLHYKMDFEDFELYTKQMSVPGLSDKERLSLCYNAIELYNGDFLHKSADDAWVKPLNAYYHTLYLRAVHKAIDILNDFGRQNEIVELARKAIIIDPLDDKLHFWLIKMLTELGDIKAAKEHYSYVMDMFYNKNGINPSQELVALYDKTIQIENTKKDVRDVSKELNQRMHSLGAIACEYEVFRYVYDLEVRDSIRTKRNLYLCMLDINGIDGLIPPPKLLTNMMTWLGESINSSLRSSDIYARYSASQYVVLMHGQSANACTLVLQRISRRYKTNHPKSPVHITCTCQRIA